MKPGTRIRISDCYGTLSGKTGTVISPRNVPTDGRGIPLIHGHYKPANWSREIPIRLDGTGNLETVHKGRLLVI